MSKRTFTPPLPDDFSPAEHAASPAQIERLITGISDPELRARLHSELTRPRDLARRTRQRFDRRRRSLLGKPGGMSERGNS